MTKMSHGQLTAQVGEKLTAHFKPLGYDVYYDHGKAGEFVGTIPISLERSLSSKNQISQLDIAVVKREKVIALIEIEETSGTPKTLIGDVFTTLMGDSVHLPGREINASVGNWTTLIVLCVGKYKDERLETIKMMANKVKSAFGTGNSELGSIVIGHFSDYEELEASLKEKIGKAIQRSL